MSNERNDGGPAFPRDHAHDGHNGMTLRDYFAAKALHALITEPPWREGGNALLTVVGADIKGTTADRFALSAYLMADAMLKAREA